MKMLPIDDIKGMLSFDETKTEIKRMGALLSTTTDDLIFQIRLRSLKSLITLAKKYHTRIINKKTLI